MDASTYQVPPRVAALAQRQQLGSLIAAHKGDHPLVECGTGLVISAVLFGAAAGISWIVSNVEFLQFKLLAMAVVLLAIGGLAAAGYAFFRLFGAYVIVHHYQHGLVWTRNRSVDAVPFSWIDEMYVTRKEATGDAATGSKITAAGLVTLDGRAVDITGADKADYAAFVERIEAELTARGRLIRPERRKPPARGAVGLGISDKAIAGIAVIGGGILIAAVAVPLAKAGLPGAVAAVIGFLVIGTATGLLGARLDPRFAVVGGIHASIGGLVAMIAAARALPQLNGYLVATVVLIIEMGILAAVLNAYRRLPALSPTGGRKRIAARYSWEYLPTLPVPIPGPNSARKVIGVQEGAQSVELYDVLRGTVDGVPVLVGDRYRRKPRRSDPVQTIWMVPLPTPLPFLPHTAFDGAGQVTAAAPDPALASLFAGRVPLPELLMSVPPWWIEGQYLLCEGPGDPDTIVAWSTRLTRAVRAMPWDEVRARAAQG
ncbi:hypothetical protein ACFO1B_06360 [Dactylosporangium siamense]|uniref:Uncharacterized protein n=1 Tax=Dactylosporangium siamense TaxID=685454 RepID=A0A919PEL1_9ACTN|nr:hypothetical protein [Dactylosporangium siamense]GIG43380.1 hypothetical protein Dsi01nite_014210 [Dactylosporangium siamense]